MNSMMSGWSTFKMTIFAARRVLPPLRMTPRESIVALHERYRSARDPAAGKALSGAPDGRQVRARARAPLEEHPLGLGQVQDRGHRVIDGVDEARRALRLRLDTAVEPHRRVERRVLVQQQKREVVAKRLGVVVGSGSSRTVLCPSGSSYRRRVQSTDARCARARRYRGFRGNTSRRRCWSPSATTTFGDFDVSSARRSFSPFSSVMTASRTCPTRQLSYGETGPSS